MVIDGLFLLESSENEKDENSYGFSKVRYDF